MKQGLHQTLKLSVSGLNADALESAEFIFKQDYRNDATRKKYVVYKAGEENDEVFTDDDSDNVFYIPFSIEETFLFQRGKNFYCDARIHYTDTPDNPIVRVVAIPMETGLFGTED